MSCSIRSNYRTMLGHLVRLPDMEIQSFYRSRYRTLCRAASAKDLEGSRESAKEAGEQPGRAGKDLVRANRYMAQIRREIRRLQSISQYLSASAMSEPLSPSTGPPLPSVPTSTSTTRNRSTREERKFALRAYERMVDATYARTGKRRWEVLEALYPSSIRTPSSPPKDPQTTRRNQPRIPPSPPVIPAYLKPLEKTVNLTVQAHREKKLKEIYGSDAYKEAITVRRDWKRWSKFMKGVAVPLPGPSLQSVMGTMYDQAKAGSIMRLLRYESSYTDDAPSPSPKIDASTTATSVTSSKVRLPRPIQRIHERMIARIPVLPVLQDGASPSVVHGKGTRTAEKSKGWIPPPASEDDLRWIPGAAVV